MPVDKEQSAFALMMERQSAPQQDAAVASENNRETLPVYQGRDPCREFLAVATNRRSISNAEFLANVSHISRRNHDTCIFGPKPLDKAVRSKHPRHFFNAGLFAR